jgi:hypothetical protein
MSAYIGAYRDQSIAILRRGAAPVRGWTTMRQDLTIPEGP